MTQPFIRITTAKAAALALFAARGIGLPRPPAGAARSDAGTAFYPAAQCAAFWLASGGFQTCYAIAVPPEGWAEDAAAIRPETARLI
ncbi:hypothetical protein JT55_11070 [Rhodovulum sp. NI22]|nr:hypothetical protein JT55_11070 [Rhodovulum sp. NI22]